MRTILRLKMLLTLVRLTSGPLTRGCFSNLQKEELISPIINDINEILNRIGKEEEYDYIFDAEQGGVLFADEKYDISEYILEELNKGISSQ